jgi:hypothetical protein
LLHSRHLARRPGLKKGYVYDVSLTIPRCESLVLEIDSSTIKIFLVSSYLPSSLMFSNICLPDWEEVTFWDSTASQHVTSCRPQNFGLGNAAAAASPNTTDLANPF